MNFQAYFLRCFFCLFLAIGSVSNADDTEKSSVLNPKSKSVKKIESNSSFGGYTKTSIFYLFGKDHAILRVVIDNSSDAFLTTGMVYKFDDEVTIEGLGKWINNQTSDALFADAPEPKSKTSLGEGVCKVKKRKLLSETSDRNGKYEKYEVEIQVLKMGLVSGFRIKSFEEKANVFLKK